MWIIKYKGEDLSVLSSYFGSVTSALAGFPFTVTFSHSRVALSLFSALDIRRGFYKNIKPPVGASAN